MHSCVLYFKYKVHISNLAFIISQWYQVVIRFLLRHVIEYGYLY